MSEMTDYLALRSDAATLGALRGVLVQLVGKSSPAAPGPEYSRMRDSRIAPPPAGAVLISVID